MSVVAACLILACGASAPSAAADASLMDDLAALHRDGAGGTLSPYIVEAVVAAGHDPRTWPDPSDAVLDRMTLPEEGPFIDLLRPAHALAVAGAFPDGLAARIHEYRDGLRYGDGQTYNDDLWALRTLHAAGRADAQDREVAAAVAALQDTDGGWGWHEGGASETDMTGMAVETLLPLGVLTPERADAAAAYLGSAWTDEGGAGQRPGDRANCNSTVWTIRGLRALGRPVPEDAWAYLEGLRVAGGVAYQPGQPALPLCTAEVATLYGDIGRSFDAGAQEVPWSLAGSVLPLLAVGFLVRRYR